MTVDYDLSCEPSAEPCLHELCRGDADKHGPAKQGRTRLSCEPSAEPCLHELCRSVADNHGMNHTFTERSDVL